MGTPLKHEAPKTITAYKGFDENWQCRKFQYEVGKSYEHKGEVIACESGFHACEHPLNVLAYYPPGKSKFAVVELTGNIDRQEAGDTKIAAAKISIVAEIELGDLAQRAVDYVFGKVKWLKKSSSDKDCTGVSASGDHGAATASGRYGAATASGECGAATASGRYGAATASGKYGAATASGLCGAATASGKYGAATASGRYGAATASGKYGAAIASGDHGAATASGWCGAATASGYQGVAMASGWYGNAVASGEQGAAIASGYQGTATASGHSGKAKGAEGSALFLCERDESYKITSVWSGIVGQDGIKPNTFYKLVNGKPVEVTP